MSANNIDSLYSLIKQKSQEKGRPLKIICDGDEVLQPVNPTIGYELIEENKWGDGERPNFEDYLKFFWENASMEFVPRQRTTNTGNKEIEKIRKKPEEFEEKIRKPFFKKLNASDFYSKTPFLSIAEELLLAFRENLIKKTVIITTTYGIDNRKKKKYLIKLLEIFQQIGNLIA